MLHGGSQRGVDAVEMIDASDHDQACKGTDIRGGAQVLALVSQCEVGILRGALDLEEHAESELTTTPSTSRA